MIQMNVQNRRRLTDLENELTVAGGQGPRMGRRDSWGVWDGHIHTAILKIGNQQGPTVQHLELCSMLCGSLDGGEFRGEWIHAYVWLSPSAVHLRLSQHCL